ncbi:amidohydrolase family protein [Sphingomonas tabacisoli]|uniref:Amidohydrolase family protein n=1 Tax=Sphingomonas tabacisoli TaxID=2249466 RepID=A0ABW4I2K4_9SPHN
MNSTLFVGARVWDATGAAPFEGDVLVQDERVAAISRTTGQIAQADAQIVDARGLTLMPGLVEGHGHLSFEAVTATEDLIRPSPEEQVFSAARGAKALLDAGFTSVYGASEAKLRLGVAVRNEVNAGRLPGPRIRAGGLEISVTGAMGDEGKEHNPRVGPSSIVDGVDEMRRTVRLHCREGVDNIKLDVSGDPFYPGTPGHTTPMTFEEIRVAAETAHAYGRKINAHTRSIEGSKRCIHAGVDGLFHCEHSDEELLDMMEEAKDRIFVVPTVSLFHTIVRNEAAPYGLSSEVGGYMGINALLEESVKTHTELRKRGVRHLIGGDYGFAWSPQGTNARDLQFFVDYYGYTPEGALLCATRNGGLAMRDDGALGTIREGQLADLLLVDGDPSQDARLLTDADRIVHIMVGGRIHKHDPNRQNRRAAA